MNSATSNVQLIAEYTVHLHAERGLSENTVNAYVSDLWQYAEVLDQRNLTLFTADKGDVAGFLVHLSDHGIKEKSRCRKIATLNGFYEWLIRNERLEKNPMRLESSAPSSEGPPRSHCRAAPHHHPRQHGQAGGRARCHPV